jgi:cytochrome c oxidase assembly factor CtaG
MNIGFPEGVIMLLIFATYIAVIGFVLFMLWRLVKAFESIARSQDARARIAEMQLKQMVAQSRSLTPTTHPDAV